MMPKFGIYLLLLIACSVAEPSWSELNHIWQLNSDKIKSLKVSTEKTIVTAGIPTVFEGFHFMLLGKTVYTKTHMQSKVKIGDDYTIISQLQHGDSIWSSANGNVSFALNSKYKVFPADGPLFEINSIYDMGDWVYKGKSVSGHYNFETNIKSNETSHKMTAVIDENACVLSTKIEAGAIEVIVKYAYKKVDGVYLLVESLLNAGTLIEKTNYSIIDLNGLITKDVFRK